MTAQLDIFNNSPEQEALRAATLVRHDLGRQIRTVLAEAQLYGYPNLIRDPSQQEYDAKTMPIWYQVRDLYFPAVYHIPSDETGLFVTVTPRTQGAASPVIAQTLDLIAPLVRVVLCEPSDATLYDWSV